MHIFNVWTIIMQSLNIKEWILLEFVRPSVCPQHFCVICNTISFHPFLFKICIMIVHIKLLELQITQTRHPLCILDEKTYNNRKNEKIFIKHALNRRCTSSICEQSLCKSWIKRDESLWCYKLHKSVADRRTDEQTPTVFIPLYSNFA